MSRERPITFRYEAWDPSLLWILQSTLGGVIGNGLLSDVTLTLTPEAQLRSCNDRLFRLYSPKQRPSWVRMLNSGERMQLFGNGRMSFTVRSDICGCSALFVTSDPVPLPLDARYITVRPCPRGRACASG